MRRLAVTLGDPRGIGPEITRAALQLPLDAAITVVGPDDLIEDIPAAHRVGVGTWAQGTGRPAGPRAHAPRRPPRRPRRRGRGAPGAGRAKSMRSSPRRPTSTPCTWPAFRIPGHTEWLAHLCGDVPVAMMLASDRLRVVLVTTHVALRDVPALLTTERDRAAWRAPPTAPCATGGGSPQPRLALCALNPHAGESGLFGDEEIRVLRPAAEAAHLAGPFPADTVFVRAMRGEFDAVLAPYHDVGMTAIKVASFGEAVNVTLGLPFPRTSPGPRDGVRHCRDRNRGRVVDEEGGGDGGEL